MPRYYKGTSGYTHVKNVENVEQLLHHLIMLSETDFEPYRKLAKQYLNGDRTPNRKLKKSSIRKIAVTKHPRHLIKHVVREVESHKDPTQTSQLGGGLRRV